MKSVKTKAESSKTNSSKKSNTNVTKRKPSIKKVQDEISKNEFCPSSDDD